MKRSEQLMRLDMPYGRRVYANGAEELFNRQYEVIGRHGPTGEAEMVSQEFYYGDRNPPWLNGHTRKACERILLEWVSRHA